jgi:hypothetical protein
MIGFLTTIIIWLILGIIEFIIISYQEYKVYNSYYSNIVDIYLILATCIIGSPVMMVFLINQNR